MTDAQADHGEERLYPVEVDPRPSLAMTDAECAEVERHALEQILKCLPPAHHSEMLQVLAGTPEAFGFSGGQIVIGFGSARDPVLAHWLGVHRSASAPIRLTSTRPLFHHTRRVSLRRRTRTICRRRFRPANHEISQASADYSDRNRPLFGPLTFGADGSEPISRKWTVVHRAWSFVLCPSSFVLRALFLRNRAYARSDLAYARNFDDGRRRSLCAPLVPRAKLQASDHHAML